MLPTIGTMGWAVTLWNLWVLGGYYVPGAEYGIQTITRAELIDYLDQRGKITASVLERIERRLELIERQLDARPSSPVPQDPAAVESGRRKRKSNKTDARLRVRLQFVGPTRPGLC